MRAQASTAFSCTPSSSKVEFLKPFTGAGITAQCTRKEAKILDHVSPGASLIPIKADSLSFPFSLRGWFQVFQVWEQCRLV